MCKVKHYLNMFSLFYDTPLEAGKKVRSLEEQSSMKPAKKSYPPADAPGKLRQGPRKIGCNKNPLAEGDKVRQALERCERP